MTNRNCVIAITLSAFIMGGAIYFISAMRPLPTPIVIGQFKFRVVEVSNRRDRHINENFPTEQVWITVQIDPSDPRRKIRSLSVYMPNLLGYVKLIGPDGSHLDFFSAHELEQVAWYDRIRKIGRRSYLQMSFGFDNKAHWKTGTLTTHFDAAKWHISSPDELSVSGKTLRLGPIVLR